MNIHGNRVLYDELQRRGSGYVAKHGTNFLMANDLWFRGVTVAYGPDGGVYVSDWNDLGECHDMDGSFRSSGWVPLLQDVRRVGLASREPAGQPVHPRLVTRHERLEGSRVPRRRKRGEVFVRGVGGGGHDGRPGQRLRMSAFTFAASSGVISLTPCASAA